MNESNGWGTILDKNNYNFDRTRLFESRRPPPPEGLPPRGPGWTVEAIQNGWKAKYNENNGWSHIYTSLLFGDRNTPKTFWSYASEYKPQVLKQFSFDLDVAHFKIPGLKTMGFIGPRRIRNSTVKRSVLHSRSSDLKRISRSILGTLLNRSVRTQKMTRQKKYQKEFKTHLEKIGNYKFTLYTHPHVLLIFHFHPFYCLNLPPTPDLLSYN